MEPHFTLNERVVADEVFIENFLKKIYYFVYHRNVFFNFVPFANMKRRLEAFK